MVATDQQQTTRGYAHPEVLVSTEWVAEHLNDPQVRIVESDEDILLYEVGHIPGAVKLDWHTDLQDPVERDFVDKAGFEQLMSRAGIANETTVVFYGDKNNWYATYTFWLFKYYGHEDCRVMDGGRAKWEAEGRPYTRETPTYPPTTYTAKEPDPSIRAFRDDVLAAIGAQNLIDVRSPDEYSGRLLAPAHLPQEQAQRAGHVPTARSIPWSKAANDDGTFKSDEELRELYIKAGVDLDKPTIAYCRIGERAAHTWFALHELLGLQDVKNYDGSWTEYGSLVGVPVELGEPK